MDSNADRLNAIALYKSLTNPETIRAEVVGKTMKIIIVSNRFEGMTVKQRIDFLKPPFFASELSKRYLASFEAYTPSEAGDSGFGSGNFDNSSSGATGSDKTAAKPAEV